MSSPADASSAAEAADSAMSVGELSLVLPIVMVKVRLAVLAVDAASLANTMTVQVLELDPQPGLSKSAPPLATNLSTPESISNRLLSLVVIA